MATKHTFISCVDHCISVIMKNFPGPPMFLNIRLQLSLSPTKHAPHSIVLFRASARVISKRGWETRVIDIVSLMRKAVSFGGSR